MRKLSGALVLVVCLLVSAWACSEALPAGQYTVGAELPAGWYSVRSGDASLSSVFLPSGASLVIDGGLEVKPLAMESFNLEAGLYVVGEMVPPGAYSIEAVKGDACNYFIENEKGSRVLGGVIRNRDQNERIGNVTLLAGYRLSFDSPVVFGPAGGLKID